MYLLGNKLRFLLKIAVNYFVDPLSPTHCVYINDTRGWLT
jgi:hypothetical protein